MALARPTGDYVEEMLTPDGWPEVDEDLNFGRADQYMEVFRQVTEVLDDCIHEQCEMFDSGVWSGRAAGAANGRLGTIIDVLKTLQNGLATVITWHRYVAGSVIQAKSDIYDIVELAQRKINALENELRLTTAERTSAITTVVTATQGANADVVAMTAEQILASKIWKPPDNALRELLDQHAPPPEEAPDESSSDSGTPGVDEPSAPGPALPEPGVPPPAGPGVPGGVAPSLPGTTPSAGWSPTPAAGVPRHAAPDSGPTAPGTPRNPAASSSSAGGDDEDEGPAAPASSEAQSSDGGPHDDSPRVAPASATGMPVVPVAPAAAGAGASAGSGAGSGGGAISGVGAPAGRAGPGGSTGVRPAAATARSAAHAKSTDQVESVEGAAAAVIPVSAARAERDAVADAATADAERRKGPDQLQVARRIAAALNAPINDREPDVGFFWVTGVTTDGDIVVANSYGLAYIPEGVQLPAEVHMATADETIPAAERASWATYPGVAVQGWAAHRNAELRALIATEEQLADSNPDAAKIVLQGDDIPDSGVMVGRSRLAVVDPEAAQRLAEAPDARLNALLPPASADANPPASADVNVPMDDDPPPDQRSMAWVQVMMHMFSDDPRRAVPHLREFHTYAACSQEALLKEAHTAVDPVAQRSAVADWLYWKHLTGLLGAALSATTS